MANVRKVAQRARKDGTVRISWRATWTGTDGQRQSKNFPKKGDADAFLKSIGSGLVGGSASMTVEELARAHYAYFDGLVREGIRETSTRDGYGLQISRHLLADRAFARLRLSELTTPKCQQFLDDLLIRSGSLDIVKRLRRSLVTWCKFGQRKGWLIANPAQPCSVERMVRPEAGQEQLEIPPKEQLTALLTAAGEGPDAARDAAIVRMLMFGGFRISELRGLADDAVAFSGTGAIAKVREKLERQYNRLGRVKSARARRDVPLGPATARALKAWRLKRGPSAAFMHDAGDGKPKRVAGRLFPCPEGGDLWDYDAFMRRCWLQIMTRAGLVEQIPDSKGKNRPVIAFGPHVLRHVAASLWIEQGLRPKKVQELLGHSTLAMTMDLYGHLWRDEAEDAALAQASEGLIATSKGRNV